MVLGGCRSFLLLVTTPICQYVSKGMKLIDVVVFVFKIEFSIILGFKFCITDLFQFASCFVYVCYFEHLSERLGLRSLVTFTIETINTSVFPDGRSPFTVVHISAVALLALICVAMSMPSKKWPLVQ